MSTPPPPAHQPDSAPSAPRPAPDGRSWAAAGQQPAATVPAQGAAAAPVSPWASPPRPATAQQPATAPQAPTAQQPAPVPQPASGSNPPQAAASPWAASADVSRAQSSPWGAQRRPQQERVTSRLRRVVEGLPDWEPLPPGETLVRRPGSTA